MIRAVFWDIDGTLLTTMRAGVIALQDACREIVGQDVDLDSMDTRGVTDSEIAARILERCGRNADEGAIARLLAVYARQLPSRLPLRNGTVLPGVVPVLQKLRVRRDVISVLLTGNTARGAAAKLTHFGLADYFPLGAYSDGCRERHRIAEAAVLLAERAAGQPIPAERRFVVGDTPHDVECARHIGARTIAVATGGYSADELRACGAWRVLPRLPAPAEFEQMLGLTAAE